MKMHTVLSDLADLLLPRHCAVCEAKLLGAEEHLCTGCAMDMPLTYFWVTAHNAMADKLNARIQLLRDESSVAKAASDQGGIRTTYESYSYACALYFYKGGYESISKAVKYGANLSLGHYISQALARKLRESIFFRDVDLIIPVPLHWTRRLGRGYNQAEVIARSMASAGLAPCNTGIISRSKRTRSQATIGIKEKSMNVRNAFHVDEEKLRLVMGMPLMENAGTKVRHILIVDDVFTTGSTITECHQALRRSLNAILGPKEAAKIRISAATLAFVGD